MRTAAALSEHPLATHAVGECVGALLEQGGPSPDLLVLFVTAPQLGVLEDVVAASRQLLDPRVTLGASAVSVLAGGREVEEHSAVAAFGLWFDDAAQHAATPAHEGSGPRGIRLTSRTAPEGPSIAGLGDLDGASGTLVLLADPFSFPIDLALEQLATTAPGLVVVGGLASAARQPGGNRLVLDSGIHADGAVGVLLPPRVAVTTVVSQGCRPIGQPLTVTAGERNLVAELAGRPALERLLEAVDTLAPEDRQLAAQGVQVGRVIDERRPDFGRGDFLIRSVVGADRERGVVAIGDEVEVGATLQFQLRDAAAAHDDLVVLLGERDAAGALVFTCNGRGSALFGVPDHDAAVVSESLGGAPVAGMFCAGEFGPIGGANFVHGSTASVVLFG